ncbi:MAG: hypothetical protein ISS44_02825 [Candidatus Omnitrophica bacterium]|nr:hypothetical protein [Candidatus Omnitrophota bacterium]
MREHLGFLRVSSAIMKTAAWIFLILGLLGGLSILRGIMVIPETPRWMGLILMLIYAFIFLLLYLVSRIADLLIDIINEMKRE